MLCTARALEGHYPNQWLGITAAFLHNSRSPPLPPYISHSPELGSVETRNTFCFEIFTYHFHIMGHQSRQEEIKQIQYSNVLCQELILHSSYDGPAQPSPAHSLPNQSWGQANERETMEIDMAAVLVFSSPPPAATSWHHTAHPLPHSMGLLFLQWMTLLLVTKLNLPNLWHNLNWQRQYHFFP